MNEIEVGIQATQEEERLLETQEGCRERENTMKTKMMMAIHICCHEKGTKIESSGDYRRETDMDRKLEATYRQIDSELIIVTSC